MAADAITQFSRREPDERGPRRAAGGRPLRAGDVRRPERLRDARQDARRVRREAGAAAQPRLLPVDRARVLPGDRRASSARPGSTTHDDAEVRVDHREAVRHDARRGRGSSTAACCAVFEEHQVFRIDHYLGKETVQNMMAFRFANGIFEPLWNRNYIDHVQITAAEDIGIGTRAGYYDTPARCATSCRTTCSSCCATVAMEPPVDFTADEVRDEKVKVLHAIRRRRRGRSTTMAVRAQYAPGTVGGEEVAGLPRGGGRPARLERPRPTRRCGWTSTTGAGPACRSTCAPASGWRARSPRSR